MLVDEDWTMASNGGVVRYRYLYLVYAGAFLFSATVNAQVPRSEPEILALLKSELIEERHQAIEGAVGLPLSQISPRLSKALIRELQRTQHDIKRDTGTIDPEALGDYYGDVIAAVTRLQDADAIGPLVEAIDTGEMATGALARYGEDAAEHLIQAIRGRSLRASQVASALSTLGKITRGRPQKPLKLNTRARLRQLVRQEIELTNDVYVLEEAALFAYDLQDEIAIATIEDLVANASKLKGKSLKGNNSDKRAHSILTAIVQSKHDTKK